LGVGLTTPHHKNIVVTEPQEKEVKANARNGLHGHWLVGWMDDSTLGVTTLPSPSPSEFVSVTPVGPGQYHYTVTEIRRGR
jgi:hypothetical protein